MKHYCDIDNEQPFLAFQQLRPMLTPVSLLHKKPTRPKLMFSFSAPSLQHSVIKSSVSVMRACTRSTFSRCRLSDTGRSMAETSRKQIRPTRKSAFRMLFSNVLASCPVVWIFQLCIASSDTIMYGNKSLTVITALCRSSNLQTETAVERLQHPCLGGHAPLPSPWIRQSTISRPHRLAAGTIM